MPVIHACSTYINTWWTKPNDARLFSRPIIIQDEGKICSWKQMPFVCLLCNETQSLQSLTLIHKATGRQKEHFPLEEPTSIRNKISLEELILVTLLSINSFSIKARTMGTIMPQDSGLPVLCNGQPAPSCFDNQFNDELYALVLQQQDQVSTPSTVVWFSVKP